jgi:hypothetical protein
MGKYRSSVVKRTRTTMERPHAVWRGIGCLMMLIVPLISIAAGYETIQFGLRNGWVIPQQLLGTPRLPEIFYISSGLWIIFGPLTNIPHLYGYVVAALVYMTVIGGIVSVIYAIAYRFVGPPRYGPLDIPPPKIKVKKYTR